MDDVFQSLTKHPGTIFSVLILGMVLTLGLTLTTFLRVRRFEKRWRLLWLGNHGTSIEELLHEHLEERILVNDNLQKIDGRLEVLETLSKSSKRFLGLVRFDAFPDVAGSQSFALAIFDDEGDGAILSSIVGRNTCRVFCKPIVGGRSERDLSQEEQRAIKSAKEGGVRTILSP